MKPQDAIEALREVIRRKHLAHSTEQCTAEAYWNSVVCRTGGKLSNTRICTAANAKGWHWEPKPDAPGFQRLRGLAGAEQHAILSEREVFDFVGMEYLEPWERE